jgi:hypothetical protein
MKKLFTILFFLLSISAYTQPIMDGTFDGETVWGSPKYVADGTGGWALANAKKIYVTFDTSYVYLGAEVTASPWMGWVFIINTKDGGGSSDSWARRVYYNHTNLPDFTARGHFNSWAEIYKWTGTAWQRDPDAGLDLSEYGENIISDNQDGWVEIRVPQSTLGSPLVGDIQFYITGDYNEHGSFDACPDDDNAISWTDSSTLSNYATNIRLFPLTLNLTALIQGFYDGSTMVSDTAAIELRNTSSPYGLVDQAKLVLNTSGNSAANFSIAADATNYYLVVKHRNSIETWSKLPQQFTGGTLTYDFTTAATQAYSDGVSPNLPMNQINGKWCFWSGDVTHNYFIEYDDLIQVYNKYLLALEDPGYWDEDVTGNGFVEFDDVLLVYNNYGLGIWSQNPLNPVQMSKPNKINEVKKTTTIQG